MGDHHYRGTGPELHFYAFDLLTLRGEDLTPGPLEERREILRTEVMPLLPDSIRYSETHETSPAEFVLFVKSFVTPQRRYGSLRINVSEAASPYQQRRSQLRQVPAKVAESVPSIERSGDRRRGQRLMYLIHQSAPRPFREIPAVRRLGSGKARGGG
jgi:hypothetical protein